MPHLAARLRQALQASPLRDPTYRLFYLGSIGAAVGYTMQATIASWLMATLTQSAFMVALVQTASTLPTLLFGLLAGAMSDIVDRRRIILVTQLVMLVTIAILGVASLAGFIGPVSLLTLTFLVGCGFAMVSQMGGVALVPKSLARTKIDGVRFVRLRGAPSAAPAMLTWNPSFASKELMSFVECAARVIKRS